MKKTSVWLICSAMVLNALYAASSEQGTSLERDWLLQAGNKPTVQRIRQEIGWARELAERLSQTTPKPLLDIELKQLEELEARCPVNSGAVRGGGRAIPLKILL